MDISTCSDNIIGIDRNECPCFADIPAEEVFNVTESVSGKYLSDIIDMSDIRDSDCTGGDNVWVLANRAIEQAKLDFCADLEGLVSSGGVTTREAWNGYIGKSKSTLTNLDLTDYNGFYIRPKVRGMRFVITDMEIWLNASEAVTVHVIRSDDRNPTSTVINAVANTWNETTLSTPIEITYKIDDPEDLEYYIVYETTSLTRNNNDCMCKPRAWGSWMEIGQAKMTDLADSETATKTPSFNANKKSTQMAGLRFKGASYCDLDLCLNLLDQGFYQTAAAAIQNRAVQLIATNPQLANKICPKSLLDGEGHQAIVNTTFHDYNEKIKFLATRFKSGGGCLVCNGSGGTIKSLL